MSRHQTSGAALLEEARALLRDELAGLLPPERRLDALMIANAMGMAERELRAEGEPEAQEIARLAAFLDDDPSMDAADERAEGRSGLRRRLVEAIRAGRHDGDPALHDLLIRSLTWRLRETDPRVLEASGAESGKAS